jgi:hypothetical protein
VTGTSRKLASTEPRWLPYAGASIIYDNPGTAIPRGRGATELGRISVRRPAAQRLYRELERVIRTLEADGLRQQFGFHPLPRPTYHLTLCDGINQVNAEQVVAGQRAPVRAFLQHLPASLVRPPEALDCLFAADLLAPAGLPALTLRPASLTVLGHALAARLEPATREDEQALESIRRARSRVTRRVRRCLGLRTQPWRLHVSLGYFTHVENAARARSWIRSRWRTVPEDLKDASIRFETCAVYGFLDMVTYFRSP